MKKVLKWLGILVIVVIIIIGAALTYVFKGMPNVGDAPDITVEVTPERVARGDYLANSVCVCMDCHSTRDWNQYAAPIKEGTFGAGGERFDRTMGFPGVYYSKNITPYGVGDWTDGELYRVITTGVDKDGEPLFPVMPYHNYGRMADEDIYSIIAYVRSLPSIESQVAEREVDAPFNIIMRMIPKEDEPGTMPQPEDKVAYGEYLVNAAACAECHTPTKDGQIIRDSIFSGGMAFEMPFGTLRSPNITPHNTGLGMWNEDLFVSKFTQYQDSGYAPHKVDMMNGDFNTVMPWLMYSTMSERDLRAIYAYLQTVKPIEHEVTKITKK